MSKHYSLDNLKEIAGDDKSFLSLVAKTFLDEIPIDLKAMTDAVENENKELAYQFAHKMKPNIEMFNIDILNEITTIERWSKNNEDNDVVKDIVNRVNKILKEVFVELKADFK
ncbi:hypothetical protein SCB49_10172 [unidentified eubacterium SCB49]|nr:hypothetical protein SCB49_10172 [unidentified eubacterium SCB49]